ncbi:hypothetical protein PPSIR1_29408 [Plesiocystis pacifica SIR-1]|uniref:Uncharacterized protein n=1 Tax=Plesiocystis pacifica SIR-1 TaxID=391625 RepID=A6G649_9BACT|nr:hypothetical protein [Plesiocystis pacifica]EDM78651.1 hypothetical protein PPSIR1_29408 [Plesiocystis pacifica SIR-1]
MDDSPDASGRPDSFRQRYGALIKGLAAAKLLVATLWLFGPYTPFPVLPRATLDRCDQAELEAAVEALEAKRAARLETVERVYEVDELQAELLLELSEAIGDACRVSPHYAHARLEYTSAIHSTTALQRRTGEHGPLPQSLLAGVQIRREFDRRCEGDEPYATIVLSDDRMAAARSLCGPHTPHFFTTELLIEFYLIDVGISPELALRAVAIDEVGLSEADYDALIDAEFSLSRGAD